MSRAGTTCLTFAAAALLSTNKHQARPSIGPGFTEGRSETGINDSTALRRSQDSFASCASLANVGESCAAWCKETGCRRRSVEGEVIEGTALHFIITDAWLAKSRAVHLSGTKLVLAFAVLSVSLMLMAAGLYHWVFLKGAREGWPVVGTLVRLMVKDEFEQRDRFMRENLDAMARKLGEVQAKMIQLEALGERVSGLAGVNPADIKVSAAQGGVLVSGRPLTMEELQATLADLDKLSAQRTDLFTVMESRLFDQKIKSMMVPTQQPVPSAHVGSAFGWRIDPFNGRSALHTGLDFQADSGTPILAAAGGVVVAQEVHPAYGNMVEIDHGNNLVTRYAHASRFWVKKGDLVKRGQKIAEVGTTGRSTGPHLHFEVMVQGVPQDPQKFLAAGRDLPVAKAAQRARARRPVPMAAPG